MRAQALRWPTPGPDYAPLIERLRHRVEHLLSTASSSRRTGHTVGTLASLDALIVGVAAAAPDRARAPWASIKNR